MSVPACAGPRSQCRPVLVWRVGCREDGVQGPGAAGGQAGHTDLEKNVPDSEFCPSSDRPAGLCLLPEAAREVAFSDPPPYPPSPRRACFWPVLHTARNCKQVIKKQRVLLSVWTEGVSFGLNLLELPGGSYASPSLHLKCLANDS